MQIYDYKIILSLNELQKIYMTIHSIAFKVKLINIFNWFNSRYLPYKIMLCHKPFDSMHILKIFEAFKLVARNVNRGHISKVAANVFRYWFDLIMSQIQNLDSFRQHPELLNFIVA